MENPKYFWKKWFTSFTSASALPIFAGLPLCCECVRHGWSRGDHYALIGMIAVILQKMGWKIGNVFFNKLGWPFFGDVFDFICHRIVFYPSFLIDIYFNITTIPKSGASFEKGPPSKNSIYVPKMGELVFGFFAFRIHPFLGDHLENGRIVGHHRRFKFL